MDDSSQTRLQWMRLEFQDARRRRLVKAGEPPPTSRTDAETQPPAPIDAGATQQPADQPKVR